MQLESLIADDTLMDTFTPGEETLELEPSAQWILEQETAAGVPSVYRTAHGAFRLREAVRDYYVGPRSTGLRGEYHGATKYVTDRYGGWDEAKLFWEQHGYF